MATTSKLYGQALMKAMNKELDWDSDSIKVLLCSSSYTPSQDSHVYTTDITNEIANGNGYTTGGATLSNCSMTYTAGTNTIKLDADDVTWANATITASIAVVYDSTTNLLIGYIDFGAPMSSSNGDFKLQFDTAGIFTVTIS